MDPILPSNTETPQPPKEETYLEIKLTILELINQKERGEATEVMVSLLEKENTFYTIRDDDKLEIWAYQDGIYIPNGCSIIKEKCREILNEQYTTTFSNQVISKIETDTYIEQQDFFVEGDKKEIIVENGILNLQTLELKPYDPQKIYFTKIPITYNKETSCPHIIEFLNQILKNPIQDIQVIQELFGYLLWKEYNIERAIMLVGTGRNGKSKCMELMKRFVGVKNTSSRSLQNLEGENFNVVDLHLKLANLCGDLNEKALKDTATFKGLTGRDEVTANRKFKTSLKFTNYAKLIFATNTIPRSYDLTEAFFMRWVILEFPYTFLKEEEYQRQKTANKFVKLRDPDIIEKITTEEEMSGLLNWAIIGLQRLLKQKDFSYMQTNNEVKKMWLRKSDSFMGFCMDTLVEEYGHLIEKSELRNCYNEYCRRHKLKPFGDKHVKYVLTTEYGAYDIYHKGDDGNRSFYWSGINFSKPQEQSEQQALVGDLDINNVVSKR